MISQSESISWRQIEDLSGALQLVDVGQILSWKEAKRVVKLLSTEDLEVLVRHIAQRMPERMQSRLPQEILVETLLNLMAIKQDERLVQVFLESILEHSEREELCFYLVEIALNSEISEQSSEDEVFSMAVSLICELGLAVFDVSVTYPGEFKRSSEIMDHISTYLLSVSNSNSNCIRFSLLNYFGTTEHGSLDKIGFNKIMGRFGHTVLDQLFDLLFKKKSEAIALQYLVENLPFILGGDMHAQRIVHETWKFYMLKKPERFGLFVQTFAKYLLAESHPAAVAARRVLCQHLGALLNVVSEVNHRELSREIICALALYKDEPLCRQVIYEIASQDGYRGMIKDLLAQLKSGQDKSKVIESAGRFVASKRGRKPSFQNAKGVLTISQVQFLGSQYPTAKAS